VLLQLVSTLIKSICNMTHYRTDEQLHYDYYHGLPLAEDDFEKFISTSGPVLGDGYMSTTQWFGDNEASDIGRLEYVASTRGVEPVINLGWKNFYPNRVHVKSAEIPLFDFLALAEAVVDRDEAKGIAASHKILQYEAPDIIDQKPKFTALGNTKRFLEYGLLKSYVWDHAAGGGPIAILNPSISTLKRVFQEKGELPVYFTEMGPLGTEYFQEIGKAMFDDGYQHGPIRTPLNSLPLIYTYYLGFSGGYQNSSRVNVPNMFGFELNPYHPEALNGMLSGISHTKKGLKYELHQRSYDRQEIYEDEPTYLRYYGDVVVPKIVAFKSGGEEAFNFVCTREMDDFQRCDTLLNDMDVLSGGFFFKETKSHQIKCGDDVFTVDTSNCIMDVERSCSYENRRSYISDKIADGTLFSQNLNGPYEISSPCHDSRFAKIAYLRYRTSALNIDYVRPNDVPKVDQVNISVSRETLKYGHLKGNKFVQTKREGATYVWTSSYGYRKLVEGHYPCVQDEYVQLLDHSMLRGQVEHTHTDGFIEAILRDGSSPYTLVSNFSGRWRQLEFCRIDVDYKSNFNLVRTFKAYNKFLGPYFKTSLIIAKGKLKRVQESIPMEQFEFMDEIVCVDPQDLAVY